MIFASVFEKNLPTPIHPIHEPLAAERNISLFVKRDDLIHSEVSGNKWRKLKYNMLEAQRQGLDTVLTFGGAYSNHIAATAAACRLAGMNSIGIIRGAELSEMDNPTLFKAARDGMRLQFISREDYRAKTDERFLNSLRQRWGNYWMVPEGGSNPFGLQGCAEIMQEVNEHFDFICVACGTGTTMAGLISSVAAGQRVIGFPVFKNGGFIEKELQRLLAVSGLPQRKAELITAYHFGGYSRQTPELLLFIKTFYARHQIMLDFIYTGKMFFGILDLIRKNFFPEGSKILALHTGGLQGNSSVAELIG